MPKTRFQLWKKLQAIVSDPTASGNSITFIKSISQNAQGVINPEKATVSTMTGAGSGSGGSVGLVPAPASGDESKYLKGDGTWDSPTFSLPLAADGTRGGVQIGFTQDGKNYPVQLSSEKMYVYVPWENTTYSFTDNNPTLSWGNQSKVATVGGVDIHVTMPANPNTDHYDWSDITNKPADYPGGCTGNAATASSVQWSAVANKPSDYPGGCTGNAATASAVAWSGISSKPSYYDDKAIKNITRSGTTFTATCMDDTTFTFTQKDDNTTYSAGSGLSLSGTTFSISQTNRDILSTVSKFYYVHKGAVSKNSPFTFSMSSSCQGILLLGAQTPINILMAATTLYTSSTPTNYTISNSGSTVTISYTGTSTSSFAVTLFLITT